jgi:hypothetical protein
VPIRRGANDLGEIDPCWTVAARYSLSVSVPVASASMRGKTRIFAEISIDGRNRSTAWPPVLRKVGARSTTVTSKSCRVSQ